MDTKNMKELEKKKKSIWTIFFTTAPGYAKLKEIWIHKMTPAGKIWLACMSLGLLAGVITLTVPIYKVFLIMFFVYAYCSIASFFFRPKLSLSGEVPNQVSANQNIQVRFRVKNKSRLPVYDFSIDLFTPPRSFSTSNSVDVFSSLGPGEEEVCNLHFKPLKRGFYKNLDIRGYSLFPFNFTRYWTNTLLKAPIIVLPDFHQIDGITLASSRKYQPGGVALTSHIGESPEYIGNREYRPGDQIKKIDFKSWARHAKPVVREFQEEYFNRIALILDTLIPHGKKKPATGFPEFEAAISLAASIADNMSLGEFIVDIFAAGPELYHFKSGRHITHFNSILEILACLDETKTNPFDIIGPRLTDEISNISSTICIFLDWNSSREKMARAILDSGSSLKIIIVRDSPTSEPEENISNLTDSLLFLTPQQIFDGGLGII